MKINISFIKLIYLIHIIFLIVLQNFAKDSGMGFFGISALSMLVLYALFISGVKPGIARMVNTRNGKINNDGVCRILKYGLLYSFVVGMAVVLCSFVFSGMLMQSLYGNQYVSPVFQIMAICFLLRALLDVVIGYYKGNKNESIILLINILNCVLPIVFSLGTIYISLKHGKDVAKLLKNPIVKNAFAAMGISSGYMFALIIILGIVFFIAFKNKDLSPDYKKNSPRESKMAVFANLIGKGLATFINNKFSLIYIAFSGMLYLSVGNKHIANSNITFNLFGIVFSKIFLPFLFVMILFSDYYLNEIGKIRSIYRKRDGRAVVLHIQHCIKNCFLMLLPVVVFFTFLAEPFVKVFFTANYKISASLVQKSGFLILFIGLSVVLIHLLKAIGKEQIAIIIQCIGFAVQMISLILLINSTKGSISSIIYAFYINCSIQIILSFPILFKSIRLNLVSLGISIGKYFISAFVMMIIYILLDRFINMNPFLMILAVIIGYLIYLITILALKGFSKADVQSLKDSFMQYPVEFLMSRLNL